MLSYLPRSLPARNFRFRHFLLASTISLVGSNIFDIAMPLYVLQRTGSVIDLGFVSMAIYLPHFLMAPITGYLSDHHHKRQSLLLADLGQVFFLVLLSAYVASAKSPVWPILLAVFAVKSLMLIFENISQFQLIPALCGGEDLTGGNTWFLSLHRVIQIVGPLMGGVLMHVWGIQSCIWVNILSFAATLYFSWSFKNLDQVLTSNEEATAHSLDLVAKQFKKGLEFIWRSPVFHPFIFLMFLWNLSSLTLNSPSLTYYFTITHRFTSAEYGLVISSFGLIGIFGFLASPYLYSRLPFTRVFERSAFFQAFFGTACLAVFPSPILFGACFGLSRTGSSVLSMGSYLLRQTWVPKEKNGSVNANLRMFFMAAAPVSSLAQGWLIDRFGIGISIGLGVASLWGCWWFSRELADAYERAVFSHTPESEERKLSA
jgi:MFS family permease